MSFATVLLYAGLLGLMIYKRLQGRPVGTPKQLFLLPVIITILGFEDFSHAKLGTIDIVVGVTGCGLSLLLGALRGTQNKLSRRDGTPWVQWGMASVAIFAFNVVVKLILDVAGVALGGSTSGVTASLILAVGLMLAGEAVVVWLRLEGGGLLSTHRGPMTAGSDRK
jgi:predicted acyltransferase